MNKLDVVVTIPNDLTNGSVYPYKNIPLIKSIAMKLICLLYEDKGPFKRVDAKTTVLNYHVNNGGLPPRGDLTSVIKSSLGALRKKNRAVNIVKSSGFWEIPVCTITVGKGAGSVYLYHFNADRNIAIQQGNMRWKCKIGFSEGVVSERIKEQIKGTSEHPLVPLIIKTDRAREIEKYIHETLFALGKHVEDAPGTEWFITNPDEVLDIYSKISEK